MKRVRVLKQSLPYGRRYHQVGEELDMTDDHARLFIILGRVEEVGDTKPRKRRVYKRRDVKPVETVVVEPEVLPPQDEEEDIQETVEGQEAPE